MSGDVQSQMHSSYNGNCHLIIKLSLTLKFRYNYTRQNHTCGCDALSVAKYFESFDKVIADTPSLCGSKKVWTGTLIKFNIIDKHKLSWDNGIKVSVRSTYVFWASHITIVGFLPWSAIATQRLSLLTQMHDMLLH